MDVMAGEECMRKRRFSAVVVVLSSMYGVT